MTDVSDEWFRSPLWDEAARHEFERRLARARPQNRQQYLRVKAVTLLDAGHPDAAAGLLQRVVDAGDSAHHEVAFAWEQLGDLAAARGDRLVAEQFYRRILAEHPSLSGTTGCIEIALAEVLLDADGVESRAEALALLDTWMARPGLKFDHQLFRWHLALIRAAEAMGDRETVRRAARSALELAARGPQLPRHKDVGLVRTDRATLSRLRELAA
jgi:hypothetical protein